MLENTPSKNSFPEKALNFTKSILLLDHQTLAKTELLDALQVASKPTP